MGAPDLARRLIEAFDLDDCFDDEAASWIDAEMDVTVANVREMIPDEAFRDDDASNG